MNLAEGHKAPWSHFLQLPESDGEIMLEFWLTGSGMTHDYPRQLIPWHVRPASRTASYMVDSGVTKQPPSIDALVAVQAKYATIAVSPDVLGDPRATIERTERWLPSIRAAKSGVKTAICTQGTIQDRIITIKHFAGRIDIFGAGLAFKRKDMKWTPAERMEIIEALAPFIHAHGGLFHVFGTGCTGGMLSTLLACEVDSFDSSSPVITAAMCRVYDSNLRQISIGGDTSNDGKRARLAVNLSQLHFAMAHGIRQSGLYDWLV